MAFQRSYSKVWWGSDYNQSPAGIAVIDPQMLPTAGNVSPVVADNLTSADVACYTTRYLTSMQLQQPKVHQQFQQHGFHSLDYHKLRAYATNLSRIQEVDDAQNMSKLSWEKRHSPGSLRSQDSGFSDNDESHARNSKPSSPSSKSNISHNTNEASQSPNSSTRSDIATPPTVVRRVGKSQFYSPLISVSRRISFNAAQNSEAESLATDEEGTDKEAQSDLENSVTNQKQKRRRRVSRQFTKPLSPNRSCLTSTANSSFMQTSDVAVDSSAANTIPAYNNETVYLGVDTTLLRSEVAKLQNNSFALSTQRNKQFRAANTSTPKKMHENPLLNGHGPALQQWLIDLKTDYETEVLSTLQTKSITQEAFKNLSITTNTVLKLIRQLQQRGMHLQTDFERLERILNGEQQASLQVAFTSAKQLIDNVTEFCLVLERRAVFFANSREQRRRFEDQLDQIRLLTKDTSYSLDKQHYINVESLMDDVQVLYRNLENTIRMLYECMLRVIVQSIENSRCDLMLRANINMLVTLANIEYEGLSCLNDAFVQNEAVRALLLICLDHQLTSVRALALRALAMICCVRAAIEQFSACEGMEILRDILQVSNEENALKRGDIERREAVSLLTQITAGWHGIDHYVDGLKDCVETIVEGLTQLVSETNCAQTLLLCAAALNNLSRIEITSHYSIMSNETIVKLIEAVEQKPDAVSIFLYEQIVTMLLNMSLNKKCHSHLANGSIINFITCAYETEFYKQYSTRAESEAQRRCVKAILHTLARLVHDSNVLGVTIPLPDFFKVANAHTMLSGQTTLINDVTSSASENPNAAPTSVSKLNLTRCESYV